MLAAVAHINQHRHDLDYGTDGAVIKVLDRAEREQLGFTSRAPRWAAAYKFLPEQQETTLKDITIQVGRTGVLTPVAELEPVLISGSTVSRATLHNQDEIDRKQIHIGATVLVEKAGEIIPAIVKVTQPVPGARSLLASSITSAANARPAAARSRRRKASSHGAAPISNAPPRPSPASRTSPPARRSTSKASAKPSPRPSSATAIARRRSTSSI